MARWVRTHDVTLHQKSTFKPMWLWLQSIASIGGSRVRLHTAWTKELFSLWGDELFLWITYPDPLNIQLSLFSFNYMFNSRDRLSCCNNSIALLSRSLGFLILWPKPIQNAASHSPGTMVNSLWVTQACLCCWQCRCLRKKSFNLMALFTSYPRLRIKTN